VHGDDPPSRHQSGARAEVEFEDGRWRTFYYVACCDPNCQPTSDPIERIIGPSPTLEARRNGGAFGAGKGHIFRTHDPRRLYCDTHRTPAAEQRRFRTTQRGGVSRTLNLPR
jgi:hypothetical protein